MAWRKTGSSQGAGRLYFADRQATTPPGMSVKDRLGYWSIPEPMSGCTLWFGSMDSKGYGRVILSAGSRSGRRRSRGAHSWAWGVANGRPVPAGLVVRHKCDVRLCVNPDHLEIGTHAENSRDMVKRGRFASSKRFTRGNLTRGEVSAIKRRLNLGESRRELAMEYGVTASAIHAMAQGRTWRQVEPALTVDARGAL